MEFNRERNYVAPAPLFERLVDENPEIKAEAPPFRLLNQEQFFESVIQGIKSLLQTRCPISFKALSESDRTVLNYGIPDMSYSGLNSTTRTTRILRAIKETIESYETRCRNVEVVVHEKKPENLELVIEVRARLFVEGRFEPLSFPINLQLGKAG